MKQTRILCAALICSAFLFVGSSTASAAFALLPLHNTWFQIDVAVKGESFDLDDGAVEKASVKRTAYLHINDNAGDYELVLFCEIGHGVWNNTGGGTISDNFLTDDGSFMYAQMWSFVTPEPTILTFYLNGKFRVKLDKDDNLKKATLTFLNATIMPGPFDPAASKWLFGKVKVKAKMIDETDLPAGVPLP